MHRENWQAVYLNQDRVLSALKSFESIIFLAGGTGLHRFVLSTAYRHSEDLDFFFPRLYPKEEAIKVANSLIETVSKNPKIKLEDKRWFKEEQTYRAWYSFEDNNEIIKVELLNFTAHRVYDKSFLDKSIPFRTENLYNLLLYKLKALCDRPDTIKDLFDLYFILRSLPKLSLEELIYNLNLKFQEAINIRYEKEDIINALKHNLRWDIEVGECEYFYDLQSEIKEFQLFLKESLVNNKILDCSYGTRVAKRAQEFDLDINSYLELVEVIESNSFFANEVKKYYQGYRGCIKTESNS